AGPQTAADPLLNGLESCWSSHRRGAPESCCKPAGPAGDFAGEKMTVSRITWAVALASSAAVASAATVTNTYSGAAVGDYNVAGNWSQSRVPGTDAVDVDRVVIGGGDAVSLSDDLSGNVNTGSVTVNDG